MGKFCRPSTIERIEADVALLPGVKLCGRGAGNGRGGKQDCASPAAQINIVSNAAMHSRRQRWVINGRQMMSATTVAFADSRHECPRASTAGRPQPVGADQQRQHRRLLRAAARLVMNEGLCPLALRSALRARSGCACPAFTLSHVSSSLGLGAPSRRTTATPRRPTGAGGTPSPERVQARCTGLGSAPGMSAK
jgi:hypothetical protein